MSQNLSVVVTRAAFRTIQRLPRHLLASPQWRYCQRRQRSARAPCHRQLFLLFRTTVHATMAIREMPMLCASLSASKAVCSEAVLRQMFVFATMAGKGSNALSVFLHKVDAMRTQPVVLFRAVYTIAPAMSASLEVALNAPRFAVHVGMVYAFLRTCAVATRAGLAQDVIHALSVRTVAVM